MGAHLSLEVPEANKQQGQYHPHPRQPHTHSQRKQQPERSTPATVELTPNHAHTPAQPRTYSRANTFARVRIRARTRIHPRARTHSRTHKFARTQLYTLIIRIYTHAPQGYTTRSTARALFPTFYSPSTFATHSTLFFYPVSRPHALMGPPFSSPDSRTYALMGIMKRVETERVCTTKPTVGFRHRLAHPLLTTARSFAT